MWLVRLTTVEASVRARCSMVTVSAPTEYRTRAVTVPGNPWSPSGLCSSSSTDSSSDATTVHRRAENPSAPPCRQVVPSLATSSWVTPSRVNRAPPRRLA